MTKGIQVECSRTVLNNAQILALPTVAIELIPAPGPGKIIIPVSVVVITHFVTAYASDTTDLNGIAVLIGDDFNAMTSAALINTTDIFTQYNEFLTTTNGFFFILPVPNQQAFSADWGGQMYTGPFNLSLIENKHCFLEAFATSITGGNINNSAVVNIVYAVMDV